MSAGLLERPLAVKDAQQVLEVDNDLGLVRAIVSVTGVVDEVNDLIEPGAYTKTLRLRTPKTCDGHDWAKPIGMAVHAEEWMPGDPRLPKHTKDGQPWPKEAGALVCDIQFNMDSERGRQAFKDVKFYSDRNVAEWSIGYQVPDGKATRDRKGIRHISEVDLYTVDPVLFGAAPLSMTLDIKSAAAAAVARLSEIPVNMERKGGSPDDIPQEVKYDTSPVGTPGGRQNWVDKVGGLPSFIRAIAHALIRNGKSESNAIQIAVGTVQRWARGQGNVSAKTRAKAAAALAEWERKKGESHVKGLLYDPVLEVGPDAGHVEVKVASVQPMASLFDDLPSPAAKTADENTVEFKAFPNLPGTFEERLETIRRAVSEYLRKWWKANGPDPDGDGDDDSPSGDGAAPIEHGPYVSVEGTTDSAVIASLWEPDGDRHTYQIDYTLDGDEPKFGLPDEVRLTVVPQSLNDLAEDAADGEDPDLDEDLEEWLATVADYLDPVDDMVEKAARAVSQVLALAPETKAGRVLSGSNAGLLRQAVEHLIAVLKAAGIEVNPNQAPADASSTLDTPDTSAPVTPEPVGPVAQKSLPTGEIPRDDDLPDPAAVLASIDAALAP
jgi:hypothetical protein